MGIYRLTMQGAKTELLTKRKKECRKQRDLLAVIGAGSIVRPDVQIGRPGYQAEAGDSFSQDQFINDVRWNTGSPNGVDDPDYRQTGCCGEYDPYDDDYYWNDNNWNNWGDYDENGNAVNNVAGSWLGLSGAFWISTSVGILLVTLLTGCVTCLGCRLKVNRQVKPGEEEPNCCYATFCCA